MGKNINDLLYIMKTHAKADRLIQGSWLMTDQDEYEYFGGCFFGCAMQTYEDAIQKACEKYGLPLWIGYWSEKVFEGLPQEAALTWPVELLESLVQYAGDTESLMHKLAVKRLSFLAETCDGDVKIAIEKVIQCHLDPENAARYDAWSAARSAAICDASSAARSAARSAAICDASSATWPDDRSSASSAAWSSACSASRYAAWIRERDWMIEILREDNGSIK